MLFYLILSNTIKTTPISIETFSILAMSFNFANFQFYQAMQCCQCLSWFWQSLDQGRVPIIAMSVVLVHGTQIWTWTGLLRLVYQIGSGPFRRATVQSNTIECVLAQESYNAAVTLGLDMWSCRLQAIFGCYTGRKSGWYTCWLY